MIRTQNLLKKYNEFKKSLRKNIRKTGTVFDKKNYFVIVWQTSSSIKMGNYSKILF